MSSNIGLLPLVKITTGVAAEEDFNLQFAATLADGVTPLNLSSITFTAMIGDENEPFAIIGGAVSGGSSSLLTFLTIAANKQNWPEGEFPLFILGVDSTVSPIVSLALTARSTVRVGGSRVTKITYLVPPGGATNTLLSPISPALLAALLNISANTLFAQLPNVRTSGPSVIPATGLPFVTADSLVAIST